MANIMKFVILGEDRGGPAFAQFARQVENASKAVDRNNAALKRQGAASKEARTGIAGLAGEITGFGAAASAASSGGNKFRLALAGISLASGILEPAMAGVVVAAGGLAAGFAAAGAGLGVFGVVAKSVFTEAQQAATNAMTGLSPPVRALAAELGSAHAMWKKFTDAAAPGVVGVIGKGLGLLPKILAAMKPFLAPVEKALTGIIAQLNKGLSSSGFRSFIDVLAKNSGPAITKIAAAIGNVIAGIGGILRAFMPVSQSMLGGIDKITARFRAWGTTLSGHTGFASLMQTFRTETPQAVAILKNLGEVIANVAKAMFGLSTFSNSRMLLNLLLPLSGVLADLSRNTDLVRVALYALAAVKIGQQFTWIGPAWQGIVKFAAAAEGATVAQTIAAAATRAWGLAMDALPWVALAAAVVAAALLIIKYHTQIWHFMERVWHDILAVIAVVWDWIKTHWPLLLGIITGPVGLAVLWVVQHFGDIIGAVKAVLSAISTAWNAAWDVLKTAFRIFIVDYVLTPLGWIIHAAAAAFGWVPGLGGKLKAAAKAFDQFKNDVNNALGGINNKTVSVSVAMTSATNPYPGGISGRKAAGGRITGPGGPRADTAGLFALSDGEWVIRADSAARYGLAAMDAVNRGKAVIGYASGGGVGVSVSKPGAAAIEAQLMGPLMKLAVAFAKAAVAAASSGGGAPYAKGGPGSPSAAQAYARSILGAYGWGAAQMPPLIALWNGESGWRWNALNPSSGAYGIPQALPASKMASAGADWRTNYKTQVRWGEGYIRSSYGSPSAAYAKWLARSPHWYGDGLDATFTSPAIIGVGERGPEHVRVQPLGPGGGGDDRLIAELRALRAEIRQLTGVAAAIPARTGQHVAGAVGSTGADAAFRRRYPGR